MSVDLGALVASPHWRWMPGMLDAAHYMRIVCVFDDGTAVWAGDERVRNHYNLADSRPDLDDLATLGCLLHLVREAWGDSKAYVVPMVDGSGRWKVIARHRGRGTRHAIRGATESEALTAALLAAPPKEAS